MRVGKQLYWIFQLSGWVLFALVNVFFAFIFEKVEWKFGFRLMIYIALGLLLSHGMRWIIHRTNILLKPLQTQIASFILITLVFTMLLGISETYLQKYFNILQKQSGVNKEIPIPKLILINA